jgi:hypothetical protein
VKVAASIDELSQALFRHSAETGKIRAGMKWFTVSDGPAIEHECYQFDTVAELQDCARSYQANPDITKFSIVTHSGQYQNTRTIYAWNRREK